MTLISVTNPSIFNLSPFIGQLLHWHIWLIFWLEGLWWKSKCAKNGTLINGRKESLPKKNYNLDSYKQ